MKIQCITYQMGILECRLLVKLLRQYQREREREYAAPVGVAMPDAEAAEYDLAVDMFNDLIKLL